MKSMANLSRASTHPSTPTTCDVMAKTAKEKWSTYKLAFAESRIAEHDKNAIRLGNFLQRYYPGAHVEGEWLEDTCIRLLRGHRIALAKLKWGWTAEIETTKE